MLADASAEAWDAESEFAVDPVPDGITAARLAAAVAMTSKPTAILIGVETGRG
jgi:hypothetical protein